MNRFENMFVEAKENNGSFNKMEFKDLKEEIEEIKERER